MFPFSFLDLYTSLRVVSVSQGTNPNEAERYMALAKESINQLRNCGTDLRQMGQPSENVMRR